MKLHQFQGADNGRHIYINPEHVALVSEIDKVRTEVDPATGLLKPSVKIKATRMVMSFSEHGNSIEVDVLDPIDSVVSRLRM